MKKTIIISCLVIHCSIFGFVSCHQEDNLDLGNNASLATPVAKAIVSDGTFTKLTDIHAEFSDVFHTSFLKTSSEDINSIIHLGALYNTDSERYGALLEAKLKSVLKEDYEEICSLAMKMKTQAELFNDKFSLAELNKEDQSFITNKLILASLPEEYVVAPKMMAAPGESYEQCVSRCSASLNSSVKYQNNLFGCAAGVGVLAACTGMGIPWATVGVIAAGFARDQAVADARRQYDICVQGC